MTVPAEAEQVASVRHAAREFAERHGVASPADVELAVSEACSNVVVHAYRGRAAGPLELSGYVDDGLVVVVVADEGDGVALNSHSDGLGFGLPIVAQLADRLQIEQRTPAGTVVTMGFARPGPTDGRAGAADRNNRSQHARGPIADAIEDGAVTDTLRQRIDRAPLNAAERDPMWLFAWATADLRQRRRGWA